VNALIKFQRLYKKFVLRPIFIFGFFATVATHCALAGMPIQRWSLATGTQVYLITTPNLPMLDVQIDFDAGSRRDPSDKSGLSSALAMMMSKGVQATPSRPALDENQLGEAWADLGAAFMATPGQDRFSFRLRTLTEPVVLTESVELAAQQMGRPSFDSKVFIRERDKALAGLKESLTQPGVVAGRAFAKAVYPEHPYGALVTADSLQLIQIADLQNFYKLFLNPCTATISMVGNVSRDKATQIAQTLMAQFERTTGCTALPSIVRVKPLERPIEQRIAFDSAQAHVLIGAPAIDRADPDYFPLTVGNYVLGGGGFVSRLTEQVREKRGLSYSVYSYFSPGKQEGPFTIGLQTRPDQTQQAVTLSKDILAEFVKNGPTPKELKAAKDNLIGGFPLRLDSNKKLLDNLANIAWNNLPMNYLDTWTDAVERVSIQDIKAAFKKHVHPDAMATVMVGGKF